MASAFENQSRRIIGDLIRGLGLTPEQAAGIVGNLAAESGLLAIQERAPISGRGGWGYAQWTGPRRVAFERWCSANGLDPESYEANVGFLIHELRTTHAQSLRMLRLTTTVKAAAETFAYHFEKFAGYQNLNSSNYATRIRLAERAMALWRAAGPPAPQPAPTPAPQPTPEPPMPSPPIVPPPKPWYQSKVVIGGIIAVMSPLLARVIPGFAAIDPNTAADWILKLIDVAGPLIGGLLAITGRLSATQPIAGTQAAADAKQAVAAQEAYHARADQAASDLAAQPVQEAWVPAPSRGFVPGVSLDNLDDLVTGAQRVVETAQAIAPIIGPVLSALVAASKALERRERPEPDPQP